MISGKATQYNFFLDRKGKGFRRSRYYWLRNMGRQSCCTRRVSYRMIVMIVIKLLVQGIIILVISAHAPQCL